jgi:ATP-dependent exoDNAse (exonuclease V) alpha subunit
MLDNDNIRGLASLSREQRDAAADIKRWLAQNSSPFYYLSGFAGVGKTTVVTALQHEFRGSVAYVAPTGKAALILRRKGATEASTIHQFLYRPPTVKTGKDGRPSLIWERKEYSPECDLIIADEASMIDHNLGHDLLASRIPVLVTGDPFQLPPVKGHPFFTGKPDFTLSEIHRQARGSQPLELAVAVHNGEMIQPVKFDRDLMLEADIVIVALNETRRLINRRIRRARGIEEREPVVGDQVLCFRTNYDSGVLNGSLWIITGFRDERDLLHLRLVDDLGTKVEVIVPERDFLLGAQLRQGRDDTDTDCFDFGYAITAHKAQGSEWDRVCIIDETSSPGFRYMARHSGLPPNEFTDRWLYTAVTRAVRRVDIMEAPPR